MYSYLRDRTLEAFLPPRSIPMTKRRAQVFADADSVARQAAALVAAEARAAVAARDRSASLVPGDPVLEISDNDVDITGIYQARQRMTLTYPVLNRARRILWLVTGGEKIEMLGRLIKADSSIPAGRVSRDHAIVFADRVAAGHTN
jgi:hypothetical protein